MKIHREGYPLIFFFLCVLAGIIVLVEVLIPYNSVFQYLFYLACVVAFGFLVAFFRLPERKLLTEEGAVVCPADGRVVVKDIIFDTTFFHKEMLQVSIFMSPFNVHVNWFPVTGKIIQYTYFPGRYLVAWHPKSSDANERTMVVLETDKGHQLLVRQIAGAVARRIICYAKEENLVEQGTELGFIKFGSRVDLILPVETKLNVNINQKVVGKETIIGWLPS